MVDEAGLTRSLPKSFHFFPLLFFLFTFITNASKLRLFHHPRLSVFPQTTGEMLNGFSLNSILGSLANIFQLVPLLIDVEQQWRAHHVVYTRVWTRKWMGGESPVAQPQAEFPLRKHPANTLTLKRLLTADNTDVTTPAVNVNGQTLANAPKFLRCTYICWLVNVTTNLH
jgi:hypothetical protein